MALGDGLPATPKLVTINTPGGARFSIAADYQPQFQGLVNDLESGGYTIDPSHSGGYNRRFIAGTQTPSEHAFGRAIDVNWNRNPRGQGGYDIPADVARSLAAKYGMTWGGDWSGNTRDPMHFEIRQAGMPRLGQAPAPPVPAGPALGAAAPPSPALSSFIAPDQTPAAQVQTLQAPPDPSAGVFPVGPLPPPPGIPGQPNSLGDAFQLAARRMQGLA
jgi:hypothetical protein